jgi:hypothetical protein
MRSILFGTLSAMSLAGCTFPRFFETCPLLDPAQVGCGPRVPYCESICGNPGCGPYGAPPNCGPYRPINGYPPGGGLMWGLPAVAPAGYPVGRVEGMPDPRLAPVAATPCPCNTGNIWPQGPNVQTTTSY